MTAYFGFIRQIGWVDADSDGPRRFVAVVEFPDGPPNLPLDIIWKPLPVRLIVVEDAVLSPPLDGGGA